MGVLPLSGAPVSLHEPSTNSRRLSFGRRFCPYGERWPRPCSPWAGRRCGLFAASGSYCGGRAGTHMLQFDSPFHWASYGLLRQPYPPPSTPPRGRHPAHSSLHLAWRRPGHQRRKDLGPSATPPARKEHSSMLRCRRPASGHPMEPLGFTTRSQFCCNGRRGGRGGHCLGFRQHVGHPSDSGHYHDGDGSDAGVGNRGASAVRLQLRPRRQQRRRRAAQRRCWAPSRST